MKSHFWKLRRVAGFTLVEVLMAAAVASIIMGGLTAGSIALQRAFIASDRHAVAEADVLRVADYIARDIRNSTSINTANTSPVLLSLAAGDYYDRRGTSNNSRDDIPYTPALGRSSATYGVSPLTIRYIKSGSRICREVSQVDAGVTTTTSAWIADNVDALSVSLDGEGVATITTSFALRYSNRDGGAGAPTSVFVMKVQSRNPTP